MNLPILAAEIVRRMPDLLADKANAADVVQRMIQQEVQPFAQDVQARLDRLQKEHEELVQAVHRVSGMVHKLLLSQPPYTLSRNNENPKGVTV